jgi:hypothetical protein
LCHPSTHGRGGKWINRKRRMTEWLRWQGERNLIM